LESNKGIDSKYKFILLVSKRARQLLKGAKPKIRSESKSLIRIAQEEVQKGLIDFKIINENEKEKQEKREEKEEDRDNKSF
jgi:DNA-directed RNA polymerase omega subunit